MFATRSAAALALLGAAILASCSDPTGPQDQPARITLNAPATDLEVGGTVQLAATVLNATGGVVSSQQIQWNSLDADVASVSPGGTVTGLRSGTARIRATVGTATGTISLLVHPPACRATDASGTIAVGQTASGTLAATDCRLFHGDHADGWAVSLTQPTAMRIEMRSSAFEAVLLITDMNLNVMDWASRDADGAARLVHEFPAGNFLVWATSWGAATIGAYTLSAGSVTMCSAATTSGSIDLGGTAAGTLSLESCVLPHGNAGMGWRFSTTTGVTARLALDAPGFDGLLVVTDTDLMPLAFAGPEWNGGTTILMHDFPPGEYLLWATSGSGGMGAFTFTLAEARLEECSTTSDIAVGATVSGMLSHASCRLPDGRSTEPWRITLSSPTRLRMDMTSTQFDAYLIMTDSAGRILAQDDDSGSGFNARLEHDLPAGSYIIWATSYGPGDSGSYQLTVQSMPSVSSGGSLHGRARTGTGSPLPDPRKVNWQQVGRAQ